MKYSDFLREFATVDICRVQAGHTSECVEVRPSDGYGSSKLAFLRLSPERDGEVTLSVHQPRRRRCKEPLHRGKPPPLDVDSVGLELIELSSSPKIVATSPFYMRQEVTLEATLKAGVEYLVVARSTPRPSDISPNICNVCTYASHPLGLRLSSQADEDARWAAFEAKALQLGDIIWEENDARVRYWTSEHGDFIVITFQAGRSKLLACFEWKLRNLFLQEKVPCEPDPEIISAAASGETYTREQVVELAAGQRQMTVLSWVQPRSSYNLEYSYICGSKSCCSVCGLPVGVAITGRFSGEYLVFKNLLAGEKCIHKECKSMGKLKDAAGAKVRKLVKRKDDVPRLDGAFIVT
jgi:hypothetical protein